MAHRGRSWKKKYHWHHINHQYQCHSHFIINFNVIRFIINFYRRLTSSTRFLVDLVVLLRIEECIPSMINIAWTHLKYGNDGDDYITLTSTMSSSTLRKLSMLPFFRSLGDDIDLQSVSHSYHHYQHDHMYHYEHIITSLYHLDNLMMSLSRTVQPLVWNHSWKCILYFVFCIFINHFNHHINIYYFSSRMLAEHPKGVLALKAGRLLQEEKCYWYISLSFIIDI